MLDCRFIYPNFRDKNNISYTILYIFSLDRTQDKDNIFLAPHKPEKPYRVCLKCLKVA